MPVKRRLDYRLRVTTARYDGHAGWYDAFSGSELHEGARLSAVELIGRGPGRCLDLGTGTGRALPGLMAAGWSVVGVDVSPDQIEVARTRAPGVELLVADAHALPFPDAQFDVVLSCFTHTDFDDLDAVFSEVARVLRPNGRFVYVGVHPCFASPFVSRAEVPDEADVVGLLRPGYRRAGWSSTSFSPDGIRARVGINHRPLPSLLNAVVEAQLTLEHFVEPNDDDPPLFLGFVARRSR